MRHKITSLSRDSLIRLAHRFKRTQKGHAQQMHKARKVVRNWSRRAHIDLERRLQMTPGFTLPPRHQNTPPTSSNQHATHADQNHASRIPITSDRIECSEGLAGPSHQIDLDHMLDIFMRERYFPTPMVEGFSADNFYHLLIEVLNHDLTTTLLNDHPNYYISGFLKGLFKCAEDLNDPQLILKMKKTISDIMLAPINASEADQIRKKILIRFFASQSDEDWFIQVIQERLADAILNLDRASFHEVIRDFYKLVQKNRLLLHPLRSFLDTQSARKTMKALGLSQTSIENLIKLTSHKETYYSQQQVLHLNRFFVYLRDLHKQPDGQRRQILDYVNHICENLGSKRKDVKLFFRWIQGFIYAPAWFRREFFKPENTKLEKELQAMDALYEDQIIALLFDDPYHIDYGGSDSNSHPRSQTETTIYKIFDGRYQDEVGRQVLEDIQNNGVYKLILKSLAWFTAPGRIALQTLLSDIYKTKKSGKTIKYPSAQNFSESFLENWQKDYTADFTPFPANDAQDILKRYTDLLKTHYINHPDATRIALECNERVNEHIQTLYLYIRSTQNEPRALNFEGIKTVAHFVAREIRENLAKINNPEERVILYRVLQITQSLINRCAHQIERMALAKEPRGQFKVHVTGDLGIMLRTGEEPKPNCLTMAELSYTNHSGLSIKRTQNVIYKTFAVEREFKDRKRLVSFADLEVRQFADGPFLLVSKFYLDPLIQDPIALINSLYDYAQNHLGLPASRVIFPDIEHLLPHWSKIELKSGQALTKDRLRDMREFAVYRDNFHFIVI